MLPFHDLSGRRSSLLLFVVSSLVQLATSNSSLSVNTTIGTVHGFIDNATPKVAQFLGIPFAEPPIADLRFAPPAAKKPVGSIDATKIGPACPQVLESRKVVYTVDSPDLLDLGPSSDDCLTLNIWAPVNKHGASSSRKLPVVVFIYGGNYQRGGSDTPYQIPSPWVQRSQSHIVVVFK